MAVVLRRELLRLSRRGQTWIVRALYSGVLLGFGLAILAEMLDGLHDPSELGRIGRTLFDIYSGFQMFAVCLLAPLMVAGGVSEERDAKTLDLLALTGVDAGRILFDQIASRLVALFAVVLAGAPFLAVLNSFGGFSAMELVNALYGALAVGLILGNFAGFAALVTRGGPLLPLALCLPYGLLLFTLPAAMMETVSWRSGPLGSPMFALGSADPGALLSALIWAPTLWSGWGLAVPVFRIMAGGDEADDDFGLLSPQIWAVERFKRNTWGWSVLAIAAIVLGWALDLVGASGIVRFAAVFFATATMVHAMHRVALIAVLLGAQRLTDLTASPIRLFVRHRRGPRRVRRPIVAWREVFTRSAGPARLLSLILLPPWLGIVGLTALTEGLSDPFVHFSLLAVAASGSFVVAALVATGTLLDERRRRVIPMLLLTPITALDIAMQKTIAPVVLGLPLLLPALILWAGRPPHRWRSHAGGHVHDWGANLATGIPLLPELAWAGWIALMAGNIALVAALVASSVRNPRLAWPLALLSGSTWLLWPFAVLLTLEFFDQRALLRDLTDVLEIWFPFIDEDATFCERGGVPLLLAASIAVQAALMALNWRLLAWRLKRL